ncbi:MAG TPA: PA4780 family RIO1-like protein kinase [Verrucomicrobiae bacterium]|nr:PA4780 family RIO1-like protein kinase [Verrucomicrobiae bacterium]
MRIPEKLEILVENGLIDGVVCQLMSGKEAEVYVVRSKGEMRCAKVYKDADHRSFSKQTRYQEGRRVRNSRQARAMEKKSRHGRKEQEEAWQTAEVDALQRLAEAGVRVPEVYSFMGGVLLMELVVDGSGNSAPRLNDVRLPAAQAREYHAFMMRQIVLMLCAGVVHGDLSEYNVLVGSGGPVIIDLPQAIDAAANNNASAMLLRDVANITAYFGRFAPELLATDYGREIWKLYAGGELTTGTVLTGEFQQSGIPADVRGVMREVDYVRRQHERLGLK